MADKTKKKETNIADLTHDAVFKDLATNREFRIAFLQRYMPEELACTVQWGTVDLYSINVEHTRQQDKDNIKQKEQSDIAFMFRFKDGKKGLAFAHIENQTTEDVTIVLRSLHYQSSILLDYMKSNPTKKLPLIFSIIYYANKKPFKYSHNIYDYFEDRELAERYAFKNKFVDLSLIDDEELAKHSYLSGYELIFKHIRQGDIDGTLDMVSTMLKVYDHFSRKVLIKYMSRYVDMQPEDFYDKIVTNEPELQGDVMSVAEILELRGETRGITKGRQEGRQEGVHIGEDNKAREIAIEMLKDGQSVNMVVKYAKLSIGEVTNLKASIMH
jgi:predicted transposase/invertase (TIGR01784 family)